MTERDIIKEATGRINSRIARLLEEKQSPRPTQGDSADLNPIGNYSPAKAGAPSTASMTKVNKKIHSANRKLEALARFVEKVQSDKTMTPSRFSSTLFDILKEKQQNQKSKYIHLMHSSSEETFTLRISDHSGNARNIILKGVKTSRGVSIVLKDGNSPPRRFKPNGWANVVEYVYNNPDWDKLVNIAKALFGLFDEGVYYDLAGADDIYLSPRR